MKSFPGYIQFSGEVCNPDGSPKCAFLAQARVPDTMRLPFGLRFLARFFPFALTHSTGIRNQIANVVVDGIDNGAGNPEGRLLIQTAGHAVTLATIPFANPAFGASSGGVAAALSLPIEDSSADNTGTAAVFDIVDRVPVVLMQGDVALSGAEIILTNLEITANDIVRLLTCSYTAPL